MGRTTWHRRISMFVAAATMAGFGLTGIASAQTITNTGPDSRNRIDTKITNDCRVRNTNNVSAHNRNKQDATSGDASVHGNTGAVGWGSWASLDPAVAQAEGLSYDAWRNGVTDWMANHGNGDGWNGAGDNLSWTPSGNTWASYDPVAWQTNGQSFGNWWNGAQSYLDSNSPAWLLSWPTGATHGGGFGGSATTGNASNSNSTNFTIRINNAASTAFGVNACGQSNFVPPVSNIPNLPSANNRTIVTAAAHPIAQAPTHGAVGIGVGGFGAGAARVVPSNVPTANVVHQPSVSPIRNKVVVPSVPPTVVVPVSVSRAVISNTGPNSSNVISTKVSNNVSVTNNNNVCVTNTNKQTATSGDATVSTNTRAGSSDSGDANNGNGTSVGADLTN